MDAKKPLGQEVWDEPFIVMSAPDDADCCSPRCRTPKTGPTRIQRWEVEVAGFNSYEAAPDQGPRFTVCSTHLSSQLNRWVGNLRPKPVKETS